MTMRLVGLMSALPLLFLAACVAAEPTSPLPTTAIETPVSASAVTEATVSIANMAFQPHTIVVTTLAKRANNPNSADAESVLLNDPAPAAKAGARTRR